MKKKRITRTISKNKRVVAPKKQPKVKNKMSQKALAAPLVVEPHPKDYTGFPFLTLIQYRKQPMLVIVDNADEETIKAFILDLCGPEAVDEEMIIVATAEWYGTNRQKYPLSIEFSRRGMTSQTSKIYRCLNTEFVSRIIGPVPKFPMNMVKSIKRRRRKTVPLGVEIRIDGNVIPFRGPAASV